MIECSFVLLSQQLFQIQSVGVMEVSWDAEEEDLICGGAILSTTTACSSSLGGTGGEGIVTDSSWLMDPPSPSSRDGQFRGLSLFLSLSSNSFSALCLQCVGLDTVVMAMVWARNTFSTRIKNRDMGQGIDKVRAIN